MAEDRVGRVGPLRQFGSVRLRTAVAAGLVVGVALIVAAVVLVVGLRAALVNDRLETAEARADEVVGQLSEAAGPADVLIAHVDDQWVQVIGRDGAVVAASENVADRGAIVSLAADTSTTVEAEIGDDRHYVVASAQAGTPAGPLTVLVGRSLDDVNDSVDILVRLLAAGLPLLLLVVVLVTYFIVGQALRPVDGIREQVDRISVGDLERRVPVPDTADEVSRLAMTMNRMLERLQRARDRQRQFVSDAAHELRSPVAGIRQQAEVAAAHPDRTSVTELASSVLDEESRLERLVDDLVLLARVDEVGLARTGQDVDLDDYVLAEARPLRAIGRLSVDTSGVSSGRVRGDPVALRRMVHNLLDNAASHASSRVTVSLGDRGDGGVLLRVDDDGPGIPEEDRERVFERFVRLDEARSRARGGSGLGLAIVAEVATGHGGSARVIDSPLGGARLEVVLPGAA